VTAGSAARPLNAPNPALTASFAGFVGSDTPAVLAGTLTVTTTAGATSAPGSYPTTAAGLSSSNYAISYVPGTLTVTDVPPSAQADAATTIQGQPVTIAVLSNDSDLETTVLGTPLVITAVSTPSHGTAAVDGTSVIYTPAAGFSGTDAFSYTVGDAFGGSATADVSVTVTPSVLGRFVALSRDLTWLHANATVVTGDVGAIGRRMHGHDADRDRDDHDRDDVTMRVGVDVTMQEAGSRVVGDTVLLSRGARVFDVVDNALLRRRGGSVLGAETRPMDVPFVALPDFPAVAPGSHDVIVARNRTVTLDAGAYGAIVVGRQSTLILTGGLYQIASLRLDPSATVIFAGPTELRVATELHTGTRARLMLDPAAATLSASQVVIYAAGRDADCSRAERDDDGDDAGRVTVAIGSQNVVQANIYAARGTVWLKSRTQATGAFLGLHVRIGTRVTVTLDSAFR
jgi:hypothetical protein